MCSILKDVVLEKGSDCLHPNLANVLSALWQVADERGCVGRVAFERHLVRLEPHFKALEKLECLRPLYTQERGRPLMRLTLLKREVPQKEKPKPKPKLEPLAVVQIPVVPKPKPVVDRTLPHCLVFVDVLNLCRFEMDRQRHGVCQQFFPISFFRAQWAMVRKVVADLTTVPVAQQDCNLYARLPKSNTAHFLDHCNKLRAEGLTVTVRDKKDVDSWLIVDLMDKPIRFFHPDREVKLVLLSGDGDYALALKRIRATGNLLGAKVTTTVLTWPELLSGDLSQAADHVFSIEDHLNRIDPTGAAQLRLYREKRAA